MTQIDFYTHVDNKLQTACVLTAKALARNMKVVIYAPDRATGAHIDNLLWSHPPIGFMPHCRATDPLAAETPIIIAHEAALGDSLPHDELLLNLHPEQPSFFSRFTRLIEIVGHDEADKQQARARWRHYRDHGYEIRTHQLGK